MTYEETYGTVYLYPYNAEMSQKKLRTDEIKLRINHDVNTMSIKIFLICSAKFTYKLIDDAQKKDVNAQKFKIELKFMRKFYFIANKIGDKCDASAL